MKRGNSITLLLKNKQTKVRQLEKAKQSISQNPTSKVNLPRSEFVLKNEPLVKNEPNLQSLDLDDNNGATTLGATSSSTHLTDLQNDSHSISFNQNSNFSFISKPITTTLINTSANAKKFKTIINPKNSLNIINISNSNTTSNLGTTILNKTTPTTIQLNNNSNENDFF